MGDGSETARRGAGAITKALRDTSGQPPRDHAEAAEAARGLRARAAGGDGLRDGGRDRRACRGAALDARSLRADPRLWRLFASAADLPGAACASAFPITGSACEVLRAGRAAGQRAGLAARRLRRRAHRSPSSGMRESVSPQELARAIDILARAETIYLLGARRVFPVTAYLRLRVRQARHPRKPRSTTWRSSGPSSSRRRRRATRCSPSASRPTRRSRPNSPRRRRGATCRSSRSPIRPSARWSTARMCGSKSRRRITAPSARSRPPSRSPWRSPSERRRSAPER